MVEPDQLFADLDMKKTMKGDDQTCFMAFKYLNIINPVSESRYKVIEIQI